MEPEKETHDKEGGDGAKSETAQPRADTPVDASKDSTAETKEPTSETVEESKESTLEKEGSESISKEEPMKVAEETSNATPENGEKDSQPSQSDAGETTKAVADSEGSESKTDAVADDGKAAATSDSTAKESSLPVPSPIKQEPRIVTLEEDDGKPDEKEATGEKDATITEKVDASAKVEGEKESKDLVEAEKTSVDGSSEQQQTETKAEAQQSPAANETTTTESESKVSMTGQESTTIAESTEGTKDTVVDDGAKENKESDDKIEVVVESVKVEANQNGRISVSKEDIAMEIETDLVQSNDVNTVSDSLEKAPAPLVADNTIKKVKPVLPPDAAYDDFRKKQSSTKKKKKSKKRKAMKIKIAGMSTEEAKTKIADTVSSANLQLEKPDFGVSCQDSLIPEDYNYHAVEKELEDSLAFFEEPHEDQDHTYIEFIKKEKQDHIALQLKKLQVEEESGKKTISQIVNQQLKEKQQSTERYIDARKQKIASKQKAQLTSVQQAYANKARSQKTKIEQGIKLLRSRHSEENSKYLQQHRHQVRQRGLPEHIAQSEWATIAQKLNARQSRQTQDFTAKGKEFLTKAKNEYESQRNRIAQIATKEAKELSAQRQSIYRRVYTTLQLTRQRHLRNHLQSIADRREALKKELASLDEETETTEPDKTQLVTPEKTKSDKKEKPYLRSVSPIETTSEWGSESGHEPSGGAHRHAHRKTAMNQISRNLSVELHNEGIWLSVMSETKTEQKSSDGAAATQIDKRHFFPWGIRARKVLESIVCGEIPSACEDSSKFNFGEAVAQNGGHVRCLLTDLRTSDATASAQRAEAIMKKEIDDVKKMEEKGTALRKNIAEQQKNVEIIRKQQRDLTLKYKETAKEYEKTKQTYKEFRTKYGRYFGPDGKPLPTNDPNATRKLTEHNMKFKVAIENSHKRGSAIKNKITELAQSMQKRETSNKTDARTIQSLSVAIKSKRHVINEVRSGRLNLLHSKSIENPANRVRDTIKILGVTTDMRRDHLTQMRSNNNSSSWVQALPGLSNSMRRALWYKMHRRRQQIVLRPTFSSMVANMRKEIATKLNSIDTSIRRGSKEALEDKLIKTEQSYLLASHPVEKMNEKLPSLPSDSGWAEPGWYLKLEVEKDDSAGDTILPCHPVQPLVQHNLSELYSAPGLQAASMINSTHLRSLETPLSAVATASSFSETDPGMAKSADPILSSNDPLKMTRDALKFGYSFSMSKVAAVRPSAATRRKSSSSKDTSAVSKASKKKQSEASRIPSASSAATTRVDNSRKRKTATQSDPNSTPRAVQRKRVEPPRQKIAVDDKAFQPRPIMTQTQQQQQPQQQQQQQQQQPFMQQTMQQQQQNHYNNQFMNAMPSPVQPQQQQNHRGSFNQFQNAPQMNQFRMMQQQQSHHHQQHSNQQNVNYGQMQQQPMRPNPQFFPQMGQQQFQQPMQIPGQGGMQMNLNNPVRQNMGSDEQNDPLFMLK